ncbi:unnamed protein product [Durusdinium trenchii]|uniref:Deacetylase sirtuin-type domain-containing protein n=1 Tax=Durusdinium trenchii TaxID=1381693 RepID=A0ABP0NPB9_9DINO
MGAAASVAEPDDLPLAARRAVLGGTPSAEAVARLLREGVVCGGERRPARVVVAAGAGLSVVAGIPDFRTPGTGLYDNLEKYGLPTPESVFTLNYFKERPQPFCELAKELIPGSYQPTIGHCFLRLLEEKGLLLRLFTQNIDGLERLAGISPELLVEAHGSFADAHCVECRQQHSIRAWRQSIEDAAEHPLRCGAPRAVEPPKVPPTAEALEELRKELELFPAKREEAWKASNFGELTNVGIREARVKSDLETGEKEVAEFPQKWADWEAGPKTFECDGLVKPDIVFFGESLPARFTYLSDRDGQQADLLLVLGTSLKVMPFAGILGKVDALCPRLLINREPVGLLVQDEPPMFFGNVGFRFNESNNYRDVHLANDCDAGCLELARLCGWSAELQALAEKLRRPQPEAFDVIVESQELSPAFRSSEASKVALDLLEAIKAVPWPPSTTMAERFARAKQTLEVFGEILLVENVETESPEVEEQFMSSAAVAYDALGEAAFLALATRQRFCLRSGLDVPKRLSQLLPEQLRKPGALAEVQQSLAPLKASSAQELLDLAFADRPRPRRPKLDGPVPPALPASPASPPGRRRSSKPKRPSKGPS